MSKPPSFPFYVNNWLGSRAVSAMTIDEEFAYFRLLLFCWQEDDCGLPDDDGELAALTRLGPERWEAAKNRVLRNFQHKGKRIYNERLRACRTEREMWVTKSRAGGLASAAKRWGFMENLDEKNGCKGGYKVVEPLRNIESESDIESDIEYNICPNGHSPNDAKKVERRAVRRRQHILTRYNEIAVRHKLRKVTATISAQRLRNLNARLKDHPLRADWDELFAALEKSADILAKESWFGFDYIIRNGETWEKVRSGWMEWKRGKGGSDQRGGRLSHERDGAALKRVQLKAMSDKDLQGRLR